MDERRKFNKGERALIYLEAEGCCQRCGRKLQPGWHGDHVHPHSKGGKTSIANAQALCPDCNRKKGAQVRDELELRDFQERFVAIAMRKAKAGERVVVADVHPGSGKTIMALIAADALYREGYINAAVVLVPRLNLAKQFEQDWEETKTRLPYSPALRGIYHSSNNPPLFYSNADGYVTTYDSLMSNPGLHLGTLHSRRFLLICDEAQQLGVNYDYTVTRSADLVEKLGKLASMIFVLSGTPFRADNSRLLFANYSEPDEFGFMRLEADITASYRQGVVGGYLRPFEAILHDGKAIWQELGANPEEIAVSGMEGSIQQVLEHPGYWRPMVTSFVEHLRRDKEIIHPRLCGLIAANRQAHAREVCRYLRDRHPDMRVLLAVSDDDAEAHENLKDFRRGNHDILVTVQMAYVGYDHKPINHILILTAYRTEGYLRQLLARGLRMWKEVDSRKQTCYAFVPDDRAMREFVEQLRAESDAGARERDEREMREVLEGGQAEQGKFSYVLEAWLTERHGMGLHPEGDTTPEEFERAMHLITQFEMADPPTKLVAFVRGFAETTPARTAVAAPFLTLEERMNRARSELSKLSKDCDNRQFNAPTDNAWGTTNRLLVRLYGPIDTCKDLADVNRRIATVARWLEQGYDGKA